MAILVPRRIPHRQKPQSPHVDRSDPINFSLQNWWPIYEGAGQATKGIVDGNFNNFVGDPQWIITDTGYAIDFGTTGETKYVSTSVFPSGPTHTLAGWVRWGTLGDNVNAFAGCHDNNNHRLYADFSNSKIRVGVGSNNVSSGVQPSLDVWSHLVIAADGSTARTYLNGEWILSFTYTWSGTSADAILLGARTFAGSPITPLGGSLRDVRYYNRALSPTEILELYSDKLKGFRPRRRWVPVVIQGGAGATVIPDNATHGHIADTATLSQNHILILDNSSHGHTADQATLTQSHILAIADSLHSHAADNATLSQTHILAVSDALHAHAADNVSLTVAGALEIANSIHAHSADQVALTQLHILATANALHGHSADNVTLISGLTLDITDAIHGHTAGQVTLQQAHILAVINASHGHTTEQTTLGVDLIIQPSSHAHTADIVSLDPGLGLAIQDAIHAHQANNITLTQQHILVISDALHNHISQNVTLSEGALTIFTFPSRTITVIGQSRTIKV